MLEAPAILLCTGIPLVVSLYCCFWFLLCRRRWTSMESKKGVKEGQVGAKSDPRRFIEIHHPITGPRQSALHCDHPILHRVEQATRGTSWLKVANDLLHFKRAKLPTISIIDPQTKLSFNPSITVEESVTKNYDTLFP